MTQEVKTQHRTLTGIIVSDKMAKTVVVRVDRIIKHPKYVRRYRASKKFKAHDEQREFHLGDRVVIEETRPLSKDKRWRVIKKLGQRTTIVENDDSEEEVKKT